MLCAYASIMFDECRGAGTNVFHETWWLVKKDRLRHNIGYSPRFGNCCEYYLTPRAPAPHASGLGLVVAWTAPVKHPRKHTLMPYRRLWRRWVNSSRLKKDRLRHNVEYSPALATVVNRLKKNRLHHKVQHSHLASFAFILC